MLRRIAPAVLLAMLLAVGGCGRTVQTVQHYLLSFQDAGPACASGTCGLQAAESAVLQAPSAITLDPEDAAAARLRDGRQSVAVRMGDRGFTPAVLVLQRGVPAELEIRRPADARERVITIPVYSASVRLNSELTVLELVPEFDFIAGLDGGEERFYVRVLDELDRQSAREATRVVERYLGLVRQGP